MIQKVKSRTDIIDSTLERRKPRSSVRHRIMLEREESRSSVVCTLPEVLQALAPAQHNLYFKYKEIKGQQQPISNDRIHGT